MDQTTSPSKIDEMISSLLDRNSGPEVMKTMRNEFKDRLALLGGKSGTFLPARFSETMENSEELRQVMAALLKKFAPKGNDSDLYFDFYLGCFYRGVIRSLMADASRNLLQAVANLNEKPSIHAPNLNYGMTEREVLASLKKLLESDSSSLQTLFSRVQGGAEEDIKTIFKDDLIALKMTHCINGFEERLNLKKDFTAQSKMNSWLRFLLIVYHCIGIDECFPRDSMAGGAKVIWETAFFCDQDEQKELFIQVLLKSKCNAFSGLYHLYQLVGSFDPLVDSFKDQQPHQIRKLLKEGLTSSLEVVGLPEHLADFVPPVSKDQEEEVEEGWRKPRSEELRKLFEKLVQEQVDEKNAARSCGV